MNTEAGHSPPPYFDTLLDRLEQGDAEIEAAFGRHVHWGYWTDLEAADGSAEDYGRAAERLCRLVCDAAGVTDDLRVLDVGCGFGGTIASLNERFTCLDMTGLNIDTRQLDLARRLVQPARDNHVSWVEADACRMPFESRLFDVVLAVECVFHFDRRRFLAEAQRVLRPGGRIALSDFCPDPRAVEYFALNDLASDEAIRSTYGQIDLTWSVNEYRESTAAHGLRLIAANDVTPHTLPTYEFLLRSAEQSPDRKQAELFLRATRRLAKASRKGLLQYTILSFAQ